MGVWSGDFTAAVFVSFIVIVFVPDSAVAAEICPLENANRGPSVVISKKYFDITAHPEAKWSSQQNILIFCFFIPPFLVPFTDTISTAPMPESLQCHLESVWKPAQVSLKILKQVRKPGV